MRKVFPLLLAVCLAATLVAAQAQPPTNNVAMIFVNKVKPGMTQQYEQGRAKHMAWHKAQNDAFSWLTWEIMTGDNTGAYVVGTFDHDWKDLDGRDKFDAADAANATTTMGASEASSDRHFYVRRRDLGGAPSLGQPAAYIQVIHFLLKPEGVSDFTESVKKIGAGMAKTSYPAGHAEWYSLASGGRGPEIVLVLDNKSYADMQGPGKSMDAMMQEAYGDQGATIMNSLRKSYYSTYTELLRFRPDLSYMAPAAK